MFAWALKWNPDQPRDADGQFAKGGAVTEVQPETCEAGEPGQCFANVNRWNARHGGDNDRVVHGHVTNMEGKTFAHAWIERADGKVVDPTTGVVLPKEKYYALLDAKPDASYTSREAIRNQFRARHHGPWTPADLTVKFDPDQPRGKGGRWIKVGEQVAAFKEKYPEAAKHYPRSSHTEMGSIETHTRDVGREWETQLTPDELHGISERFGSDVQKLMASAIALHDIGKAEAIEEGEGKEAQHKHTIPILQRVLRQEGFSEKDVSLATELFNHDLIGPLFRGYEGFKAKEADVVAKLKAKALKTGMDLADFVTLQLAFYQADASSYPYITQYMRQEPSGKWTFSGNKKIAAIEALVLKYDPAQPRDAEGRWAKIMGGAPKDFDKAEYDRLQQGHDTQRAISDYVEGGTSRAINEHFRAGLGPRWEQRNDVLLMDEHMKRNPFPTDTTLIRSVPNIVLKGLEVGDVFQDNGYVSTTADLDPDTLLSIRRDVGANPAMQSTLTIQAPKGLGHINVNKEIGDDHDYGYQKEIILPRGLRYEIVSKGPGQEMTVKVLQDAQKLDLKFVNVLRWDEALHPRDASGKFSETRGDRSPHEQKRRDFMALVKRHDREGVILDRMRVEVAAAWKVWSEDLSKGRKKPLKADGAAAKKLPSYKEANALEKAFHERFEVASKKRRALNQQAKEMLKVPVAERSDVVFVDDKQNPVKVEMRRKHAQQILAKFRQFDGSGVLVSSKFTAEQVEQIKKLGQSYSDVFLNALRENPDGTFSLPTTLRLSEAPTPRAFADGMGIYLGSGRELENTVNHEVAHHIEVRNGAVREAAIAVREKLANQPREVYKLKTVSPALDDTEEALRGRFPDPYSAKLYPGDGATEMVSTGVESYLADPLSFARDRPEHFNLIFDIMQGKYRT